MLFRSSIGAMRYRTSIQVAAPLTEAFAYVADFGNAAEWDPGLKESRRLDEGALRVGSSFHIIAVTRGNCVWRGPLMKDGSLTKVGVFYQLYGPSGPDGLAMDVEGNLAVVHARSGNVLLFNKRGVPLLQIGRAHV